LRIFCLRSDVIAYYNGGNKFSKALYIVTLHSKYTRVLTFSEFLAEDLPLAAQGTATGRHFFFNSQKYAIYGLLHSKCTRALTVENLFKGTGR